MARTYDNFDVELVASGSTYEARFRSLPGQPSFNIDFPLEEHEFSSFLAMFGKNRPRKLETTEFARVRAVGQRLFDCLFPAEVRAGWVAASGQAKRGGKGIRIRLDLSQAMDLVTVPWEYLYRAESDDFLSLSNWTPVTRYLKVEESLPTTVLDGPLKVLVMISDPIERRGILEVDREWQQLNEALGDAISRQEVELHRLPNGQLESLQVALQRSDYHIFHFIGHGEYSEQDRDGVLVLEDARGRETHVPGSSLGDYLCDSLALRLVVLNNCEGAATSESDPFAGTAQSLLRKGIPAIVAMQFEITDRAAIDFARGFYTSLGNGYPVDAALAEARKVIRGGPTRIEFGSPVLYLSALDGAIFVRDETPPLPDEKPEDTSIGPIAASETQALDPVPEVEEKPDELGGVKPGQDDPVVKPAEGPGPPSRRRLLAMVAIGAVALIALLVLFLGDEDSPRPTATTSGTTPTSASSPTSSPVPPTPFVTWSRVTHDEEIMGGPDEQGMHGVTVGGPGLVAVGVDGPEGQESAAVWTSDDGTDWERIVDVPTGGPGTGKTQMRSTVEWASGLVAVGTSGDDAAVWRSEDGRTWIRVPDEFGSLGGDGIQAMRGLTVWDSMLVAAGWETSDTGTVGAIWTSQDGIAWTRVDDTEGVFAGPRPLQMHAVVGNQSSGLVAVGGEGTRGDLNVAIWASQDGAVWERVDGGQAGMSGDGDQLANTVEAGGHGYVTGGFITGDNRDGALWWSLDGRTWSLVSDADGFGGAFSQEVHGLSAVGSGFVAVGWDHASAEDKDAAIWASSDGIVWDRVENEDAGLGGPGGQQIEAVTHAGTRLVGVGIEDLEDWDAAVWLGNP